MKTLTLPTGTWLFVKVPKHTLCHLSKDGTILLQVAPLMSKIDTVDLPPGQWQIFSLASEVTEELAAQIVKVDFLYCEITGSTIYPQFDKKDTFCDTATESFATLMAAHGMYLKNPINMEPQEDDFLLDPASRRYDRGFFLKAHSEWQSHEANVGEYLILRQVK